MTNETTIEHDVVALLDRLTPRDLAGMAPAARNAFRLTTVNGFDLTLRTLLCVPLGDIAAVHGRGRARLIASSETEGLADVGEAVGLTERAAGGKP